jgi:hypothetical protein
MMYHPSLMMWSMADKVWLTAPQQRTWLNYMRVYLRMEYEMNRQLQAECGSYRLVEPGLIAAGDEDVRACPGHRVCGRQPDPRSSPRDECRLAVQCHDFSLCMICLLI